MTDILFPPDLVPSAMSFSVDDFTAVDESATTGVMQSSTLYGTRRWRLRMDFPVLTRASGNLGRFEAFVASMRGRQNRVWISPAQNKLRGSFPAAELLANNAFQSGTASWNLYTGGATLSVTDRVGRITVTDPSASYLGIYQTPTVPNYVPRVTRTFINVDKSYGNQNAFFQNRENSTGLSSTAQASNGMMIAGAAGLTDLLVLIYCQALSAGAWIATDFFSVFWASASRCFLVDNQPNLFLQSDAFDNAAWSKFSVSVTANATSAPDLTTAADAIVTTAVTSVFRINQTISGAPQNADYCLTVCAKAAAVNFVWLNISEGTGDYTQWFNLNTGAVGSNTPGGVTTVMINPRGTITALGFGWYRITFVVRKTTATANITGQIGVSNADGVTSYAAAASAAAYVWRAGFAISNVPFLPQQTAGTAANPLTQNGNMLSVKGLPVSTQGLLQVGDMVEIQVSGSTSQLIRVTNRLDSDAGGLGLLQFENSLKSAAFEGAAVIVQQPMGRFVLATATAGVEYTPGVFGQASLEFIEAA